MAKKVTLKDVAKHAGVSYQTVSKILRDQIQVTPEVRVRVQQAVEELGYRPNVTARSLRTQASHLIGYSWQPSRQNFFSPVLEEFEQSVVEAAERRGYHILLFPQREGIDSFKTYEELAYTGRVDGFILSDLGYSDPRIPALQALKIPLVAFGRTNCENRQFPFVDVDGRAGVRQVVEHLLDQGHQRIAVLGWPEESRVGTDRLSGYWDGMEAAGITVDRAWVKRRAGEYDYGYEAAHELLELPAKRCPTAIVTVFDLIAVGVIHAVEAKGLVVGHDIAVTGFDDVPMVPYLRPGLTTLRQPTWEVGQRTINILVNLLEGNPTDTQQVLLPPELIIRESSQGYYQPS
ncbi:MAG: LacI family DNA-binding transcriptional regulator [Anaerolineae bacterium]|nr:LacI family DNA-binding transcriptional regulator [Anaerolineae bacterium]